jgi:sporulation protein YlmC with PRC-barrel domain
MAETIIQHRDEGSATASAVDYGHDLISSRRVEGTVVYNRDGARLGTIHAVMIGKRSGQVAYAVLSFGGIFGLGGHVYTIPWEALTYDVDLDGYVAPMSRAEIEQAPAMTLDDSDRPIDRDYQEQVSNYWSRMPWWGL